MPSQCSHRLAAIFIASSLKEIGAAERSGQKMRVGRDGYLPRSRPLVIPRSSQGLSRYRALDHLA
jgi:hypothetical protein